MYEGPVSRGMSITVPRFITYQVNQHDILVTYVIADQRLYTHGARATSSGCRELNVFGYLLALTEGVKFGFGGVPFFLRSQRAAQIIIKTPYIFFLLVYHGTRLLKQLEIVISNRRGKLDCERADINDSLSVSIQGFAKLTPYGLNVQMMRKDNVLDFFNYCRRAWVG